MSIYAMGSAIPDHSFVNIFCCKWMEAGHHRASPGKKDEVLSAINPNIRRKMRTNKWNLARCHLCGFHFEPDMHMCVIAATREIPYCAHGATVCACCNTSGFLTTLCKRHTLLFGIESNRNGWLIFTFIIL